MPVCGSVPIMAIRMPSPAATRPRSGVLPESTATIEMPSAEKASSSGEPRNSMIGRKSGRVTAIRKAPKMPPIMDDM